MEDVCIDISSDEEQSETNRMFPESDKSDNSSGRGTPIPTHKMVSFLQRMGDRRISSGSAGYCELTTMKSSNNNDKRGSLAQALENSVLRGNSSLSRTIQGRRRSLASSKSKESNSCIEAIRKFLPCTLNDGYR